MKLITHNKEILTHGWQCSGDLKPLLDFFPALWNEFGSQTPQDESGSQTPLDESIKCNFVKDALSNSVVLRQIFTFLDDVDLESCCNVCEDWRTLADPLIVPHFGIKLARTNYARNGRIVGSHVSAQLANCKHYITVGEGARYNGKSLTQRTDLGVAQILEVILTRKVSISLTLSDDDAIQDAEVMDFLSKIGPHVVDLDLSEIRQLPMNVADFCKLLLQKFPNLKKLNCCVVRPNAENLEDQLFDTNLPQNKHKRLRKIVFGNRQFTYLFVKTMLRMSENLEKIEDFPLKFINAIVVAQKGPALKSLLNVDYPYTYPFFDETDEIDVTAYEKLARLEPKLTSFEFSSDSFHTETIFKLVKPFLFSVLHSSHESLESLQIGSLRSYEVLHIPTLKRLKELQLLELWHDPRDDGVFFTPEMSVKQIFPNVRKFGSSNHTWNKAFINRHLPEKVICPWGAQIIELSVNRLAVSAIPLLQRRFPSIQKLEIQNSLVNLPLILLGLSRFWPQLKSLTISFDTKFNLRELNSWNKILVRLDHGFTGLPKKVIDQLADPSRNKKFNDKEIQGFKDRSVISKLKKLKELKIFLIEEFSEASRYKANDTHTQLTPVANEFGFKLLPELTVTLAVEAGSRLSKAMNRDLKALAACSNIEIVNARDGYPYVF